MRRNSTSSRQHGPWSQASSVRGVFTADATPNLGDQSYGNYKNCARAGRHHQLRSRRRMRGETDSWLDTRGVARLISRCAARRGRQRAREPSARGWLDEALHVFTKVRAGNEPSARAAARAGQRWYPPCHLPALEGLSCGRSELLDRPPCAGTACSKCRHSRWHNACTHAACRTLHTANPPNASQ
jgi:hypothetical protein